MAAQTVANVAFACMARRSPVATATRPSPGTGERRCYLDK